MAEYTIKNDKLTVVISSLGAELQSIKNTDGREFLWQNADGIWNGHAPLLFPVCGGLIDDSYILNGQKYNMPKHGFASTSEFVLEQSEESSCTYLLCADEETMRSYPFDFELRVIYSLDGDTLNVGYEVKNLSEDIMYFSIGAHESYSLPGGIDKYRLEFAKPETLKTYLFNGSFPSGKKQLLTQNSNDFDLKYDFFTDGNTLMFNKLNSKKVSIVEKDSGKTITETNFGEFTYLLLWTMPPAEYICIEPWYGIPDVVGHNQDFTKKSGNISLNGGEIFKLAHSVKYNS